MRLIPTVYVVGKSLVTADALSQAPAKENATDTDTELMENTNVYLNQITDNLPAGLPYLRQYFRTDTICSTVMQM